MKRFCPTKNEKIVVSIRMEEKTLEIIDNESNKIDVSRNEFIMQCIYFALENMIENDDNEIVTMAELKEEIAKAIADVQKDDVAC